MSPQLSQPKTNGPRRKALANPGHLNLGTGTIKPAKAARTSGGGELLKTRPELAKITGYSVRTLDRLTKARIIPHIRTGRLVRFRVDAVMAALERNNTIQAREGD